ncbi:Eukaryotic translation initiation factor 3 subunit F, partial [Trichinella sp. T6]
LHDILSRGHSVVKRNIHHRGQNCLPFWFLRLKMPATPNFHRRCSTVANRAAQRTLRFCSTCLGNTGIYLYSEKSGRTLNLSVYDKRLIEESWCALRDKDEVAKQIFLRVLTSNEKIRTIFDLHTCPDDELEENSAFQRHVKSLSLFLSICADSLSVSPDRLVSIARSIGEKHVNFRWVSFDAEYWLLMKCAMVEVISSKQRPKISHLVNTAWNSLLSFVIFEIKHSFLEAQKSKNTKSEDDHNTKQMASAEIYLALFCICWNIVEAIKPGKCPAPPEGPAGPAQDECQQDEDCPGAEKCCATLLGKICLLPESPTEPVTEFQGVCPDFSYPLKWCATSPCPRGYYCFEKICCRHTKPGDCPDSMEGIPAGPPCDSDIDCESILKCCVIQSRSRCAFPAGFNAGTLSLTNRPPKVTGVPGSKRPSPFFSVPLQNVVADYQPMPAMYTDIDQWGGDYGELASYPHSYSADYPIAYVGFLFISAMISSDFTVRVHPVVILSIVDAYERRDSKVTVNNRGVGSLLGYYEKNAVEIVNCYAVKYQAIRDECLFDKNMNKEMFDMNQLANPYTTSNEIHDSDQTLHDFYMSLVQKKTVGRDNIPVIHLVVDMANTEPHLGIYAFVLYKVKIPQTEDYQSLMLIPVQLQVVASEAERVALSSFMLPTDYQKREFPVASDFEQMKRRLSELLCSMAYLRHYVMNVLEGNIDGDTMVGRRLLQTMKEFQQSDRSLHESVMGSGLKDFLMLAYLTELTKTQLTLQDNIRLVMLKFIITYSADTHCDSHAAVDEGFLKTSIYLYDYCSRGRALIRPSLGLCPKMTDLKNHTWLSEQLEIVDLCFSDSDCTGTLKCCNTSAGATCLYPKLNDIYSTSNETEDEEGVVAYQAVADKVCPDGTNYLKRCFANTCPESYYCYFEICCKHTKQGSCPAALPGGGTPAGPHCDNDVECPTIMKCCVINDQNRCVYPEGYAGGTVLLPSAAPPPRPGYPLRPPLSRPFPGPYRPTRLPPYRLPHPYLPPYRPHPFRPPPPPPLRIPPPPPYPPYSLIRPLSPPIIPVRVPYPIRPPYRPADLYPSYPPFTNGRPIPYSNDPLYPLGNALDLQLEPGEGYNFGSFPFGQGPEPMDAHKDFNGPHGGEPDGIGPDGMPYSADMYGPQELVHGSPFGPVDMPFARPEEKETSAVDETNPTAVTDVKI